MKFSCIVRNQASPFGRYGKITNKNLADFVGSRVIVTISLEPTKRPAPSKPDTRQSPG